MANTSALEAVFAKVDEIQNSLVENIVEFKSTDIGGGAETVVPEGGDAKGIDPAGKPGIWTQTAAGKDIQLDSAKGTFVAGNEGLKANYLTETGTQAVQSSKNNNQAIKRAVQLA